MCLYFLTAFKIFSLSIVLSSSPPILVLLRYNWHTGLYKFKVCSMIKFFPRNENFKDLLSQQCSNIWYIRINCSHRVRYILSIYLFAVYAFWPYLNPVSPLAPPVLSNLIIISLDTVFSCLGFSEFLKLCGLTVYSYNRILCCT